MGSIAGGFEPSSRDGHTTLTQIEVQREKYRNLQCRAGRIRQAVQSTGKDLLIDGVQHGLHVFALALPL
eukprot:g36503.t1